ncbi:MAG: beta-lactamase family protein [Bryobacterales bacterium]|nr:beta-lactamase family protein [Bryobacterales bacterium]
MRYCVWLVAGVLCAAPPVVKDAAKAGLDAKRLALIPARMKEFVDSGKVAGVVTLVARRGQIAALDATGYTDLESRQAMGTGNIFQLHSMTKPIVSTALTMLVEEGRLALTDAVEKHLPEFRGLRLKGGGKPARAVMVRDLMTHTSGIMGKPPAGIGELHGALHKSLAEVVAIVSQQPLEFEPGTRWQYSDMGIATVGRLVEVLGGMPLEKFLEKRIFEPLGMKDTFIFPPKEKFHRMPTAYVLRDGKPVKYTADPLGEGKMKFREGAKYSLPEGGLYSTAEDLFAFYQMMLNGGEYGGKRLLSKAGVQTMTALQTGEMATNAPGNGWGLGWFVVRAPLGELSLLPRGAYGHGGRYGTFCFLDPAREMIGIFLIHREGGSEERQAFVQLAMGAAID